VELLVVWLRWLAQGHDGVEEARAATTQARAVSARLVAVGGDVRAQISGTVVATFDPADAIDALDALLDLCDEADRGESPVRLAFGVALGVVDVEAGSLVGAAVDHAQALAARARDGEVVLDRAARERNAHGLLFAREVTTSPSGARGFTIDRAHPRRAACHDALGSLQPAPIAPSQRALAEAITRAAAEPRPPRVLLGGSFAAGARAIVSALAREGESSLLLDLAGVPGGLDPLGSLGGALRLAESAWTHLPPALAGPLRALAAGHIVPRADAEAALAGLIAAQAAAGRRVWFLLDPVSALDPSSVALVALVSARADTPALVIARLPEGTAPPRALAEGAPVLTLALPPLTPTDALVIAGGILGADAEPSLTRRLALLGGETTAGLLEAACALAATGDVVRRGERLTWRRAPRAASGAAPLQSLVSERLALLDEDAQRALEVLCVLAEAAPAAVTRRVAAQDGLDAERFTRSLDILRAERLWAPPPEPAQPGFVVRSVVLEAIPPARLAELHRLCAEALRAHADADEQVFFLGSVASHLAEAGLPEDAASTLLRAAARARGAALERAALRLAAAAVRVDPRDETRRTAATFASDRGPDTGVVADPNPAAAQPHETSAGTTAPTESLDTANRAVRAIIARDFDAVERVVEAALAAGGPPAAAERIRAVAQLARGDAGRALRTLRRQQDAGPGGQAESTRAMLALALVLAGSGEPVGAVRAAVAALASARRRGDTSGEEAALRTLARCYRALGRTRDAERFESRA
jgi:hypothetical protein